MGRGQFFLERLTDGTGLSMEPLPGQAIVEITGDARVLIENHQGVQEYGGEKTCIKTSFGSVAVCGNDLRLSCLSKERLVIVGAVAHITVIRRDR